MTDGFLDDALALLLPPPVRVGSAEIDARPAFRHAAEADAVARAVDKRVREFATGRRLAHVLLDGLGCRDVPLLPDGRRAPGWPDGVAGTIAHCRGACVVAVAARAHAAGLGLDVEPDTPLRDELLRRILRDDERAALVALDLAPELRGRLAKASFVAKEAFYKALAAEVGVVLEFSDVRLDVGALADVLAPRGSAPGCLERAASGPCVLELVRDGLPVASGTTLSLRFAARAGFLLAGCVRPPPT
ncbi:MAG: 4'-phosphopantetheinyl transferase superfamily protein [Planctomycetes bacterium]|nr:4'-phosphopantetheinyl transferase superfamily protein [Planctomycetota bacterium]